MNLRKNLFVAIPFIVVGIVWVLRNMGMIDSEIFHAIVSWQMLVMYIGICNIFKGHYIGGLITFLVGVVFLMPEIGWLESDWLYTYWPVAFVVVGIMMIFKPRKNRSSEWHERRNHSGNSLSGGMKGDFINKDGYVETDNTFGSVQQIILDPVFKGAQIKTVMGGTILDLRRTQLESPETFIDIDCTFGGIEVYIPNNWRLHLHAKPMLGGVEDKRFNHSVEMDVEHVLIVRGNVNFGAVVFKS